RILATRAGVPETLRLAPHVQLTSGATGGVFDLETRIDMEPVSNAPGTKPEERLRQELEKAGPQAALVVHTSRKNRDGVLLSLPAVVAISAAGDWDVSALENAAQQMLAPGLTAASIGVGWREVKEGGYFELDGLNPIQMAIRGKVVYFSNDAPLLVSVLSAKGQPLSQPAIYAAGFSHARERENFYQFTALVDQSARAADSQPQFFSQNA